MSLQHIKTCHLLTYGAGPGCCDCGAYRRAKERKMEIKVTNNDAWKIAVKAGHSMNTTVAAIRALLTIEWSRNGGGTYSCPGCGGWTFSRKRHDNPKCPVDAALTSAGFTTFEMREAARRTVEKEV